MENTRITQKPITHKLERGKRQEKQHLWSSGIPKQRKAWMGRERSRRPEKNHETVKREQ